MSRSYQKIKQHKEEIFRLRDEGLTHREIAEILGYRKSQIKELICRTKRQMSNLNSGKVKRQIGRPCKKGCELPPSIQKLDKFTQLRYELAGKDRYIKRLEMENELMLDFLQLTGRR